MYGGGGEPAMSLSLGGRECRASGPAPQHPRTEWGTLCPELIFVQEKLTQGTEGMSFPGTFKEHLNSVS